MTERKSLHWKAFLLALGISTAVFLPFLLYNGGYFIFIGDFNAQQIPFYKLVHQAVREGNSAGAGPRFRREFYCLLQLL